MFVFFVILISIVLHREGAPKEPAAKESAAGWCSKCGRTAQSACKDAKKNRYCKPCFRVHCPRLYARMLAARLNECGYCGVQGELSFKRAANILAYNLGQCTRKHGLQYRFFFASLQADCAVLPHFEHHPAADSLAAGSLGAPSLCSTIEIRITKNTNIAAW
jgi:hypothetical protein